MAKGKIRMPHHLHINGDAIRIIINKASYNINATISGTRWTNKRDIAKCEKIRDEWLYLISQKKPIKLEQSNQIAVPSKYLTFREAAGKYLLIGTDDCNASTIKNMKKHLNAHWLPAFGHYDLEEITTELIQEYFAAQKLKGDDYENKTKTNYLQVLNNVYAHHKMQSPGHGVVSTKGKKAKKKKFQGRYKPEEIKLLIGACERNGRAGFNIRLYFTIFIGCGLRPQELLVLKWDDYDGEYLHIKRALSDGKIEPPKTGHRRRVYVPSWVRSELREAPSRFTKKWMFPNTVGKFSVKPEIYNEEWAKVHEKVGLPYGHVYDEDTKELLMVRVPYTCRHTRAAELLSMGVVPAKAAKQLGHSAEQFLGRYSEYIEEFSEADTALLESKTQIG
jgi:integrase